MNELKLLQLPTEGNHLEPLFMSSPATYEQFPNIVVFIAGKDFRFNLFWKREI